MAKTQTCVSILFTLFTLSIVSCIDEGFSSEVIQPAPEGCTRRASNGDILYMHYVGKLDNGKKFDSSYDHQPNDPFGFKLGAGHVISGWEEGVSGMCVGEKRKLTIPPSLGYGDEGYGDLIPPKSTLVFEIELMDIKDDDGTFEDSLAANQDHRHAHPHEFEHIDANNDKHISKEELINFIVKLNAEAAENERIDDVEKTVDEIIREHDLNQDGQISFEENQHFAESQQHDHHQDPHDHHHAFETIDADQDKFISYDEMKNYLLSYYDTGKEEAGKLDVDQDVNSIFAEHDLDKDGRISIEENQHAADRVEAEVMKPSTSHDSEEPPQESLHGDEL